MKTFRSSTNGKNTVKLCLEDKKKNLSKKRKRSSNAEIKQLEGMDDMPEEEQLDMDAQK